MNNVRVLALWGVVHFAAAAFGAWVVLSSEAAAWMLTLALALAVLLIPFDWQTLLRLMFSFVYCRWLWNDWYARHDKVVRVTGWRGAIVEAQGGQRRHMTACFWGLE